jgi:hypothetical protein
MLFLSCQDLPSMARVFLLSRRSGWCSSGAHPRVAPHLHRSLRRNLGSLARRLGALSLFCCFAVCSSCSSSAAAGAAVNGTRSRRNVLLQSRCVWFASSCVVWLKTVGKFFGVWGGGGTARLMRVCALALYLLELNVSVSSAVCSALMQPM